MRREIHTEYTCHKFPSHTHQCDAPPAQTEVGSIVGVTAGFAAAGGAAPSRLTLVRLQLQRPIFATAASGVKCEYAGVSILTNAQRGGDVVGIMGLDRERFQVVCGANNTAQQRALSDAATQRRAPPPLPQCRLRTPNAHTHHNTMHTHARIATMQSFANTLRLLRWQREAHLGHRRAPTPPTKPR